MAAIDKTYTSKYEEYLQLKQWAEGKSFKITSGETIYPSLYIFEWDRSSFNGEISLPVWNTPTFLDVWLIRNCPIEFIQNRLKEQYRSCYDDILNHTSEYDTFKRNGLGKNVKYRVVKKPNFNIRGNYDNNWHRCRKKHIRNYWMVEVSGPEEYSFLVYNERSDSWYFHEELASWTSSCAYIKNANLKKIHRRLKKWNLPAGCNVRVMGNYVGQEYNLITK